MTRTPLSRAKGQRSRSSGRFGWLFKSPHNFSRRQQFICHRPESLFARGGGIMWRPPAQMHARTQKTSCTPPLGWLRAGSGVERIDPLRFVAGCRERRLNQALSVLSLRLCFLSVSVVLLTIGPIFALCYFVLFVCSVSGLFSLGCQYQCK